MKRIFGLITICSVLALQVLAAPPVNFGNSGNHPLPATDIHLVKKAQLPPVVGELKGNPHGGPPGQNKDKNGKNEGPAATGVLGEQLPEGAGRHAVVIGICDYPNTKNDICWSDGDSLNMYKALTNLYGYTDDNIYLFRDTEPKPPTNTQDFPTDPTDGAAAFSNIYNAVMEIKEKVKLEAEGGQEAEVVFFFSGHGADGIAQDEDKERRDEGIVVVNDTKKGVDYIWDGELKGWFADFQTTRIAFIFDSCLAGGMNDVADSGRVISMATEETQVAYVYSKGNSPAEDGPDEEGEGVFSHYFVNEGILQGLADVYDHDNNADTRDVVVEEAFDYAKEIIPSAWKRQKPTISDKFDNDLLLGY